MIARLFEHRSGRVIALCRLVLALVFFLALWIDPAQPVRARELGYGLLGGYLLFAAVMLAIALRGWWWDHRLAWPTLTMDISAFLAAVFFTESAVDDFTSPFLAFFAFLMLAATIRWNWRMTALIGLVTTGLYLAVGLTMAAASVDFDLMRFGRRIVYMLVLTLILIWFGLQRREQHVERFAETPGSAEELLPPLEEALGYAVEQSGARAGAIAWEETEEPRVELRTLGIAYPAATLGPEEFSGDSVFGDKARLFSADRRRSLRASRHGRPRAGTRQNDEPLADRLGIGEALALPFAGVTGRGEVLLAGIPGVCADHVQLGQLIAREIGAGFDRHSTLQLSRESALARARDALARDLHDSVAQSLAGAALRLEGLRNWIRGGNDPEEEILQLKSALRDEQAQVRSMIDRLRDSGPRSAQVDLTEGAARLLADLAKNWSVTIDNAKPAEPLRVPATLAHDVYHLLREAVANAVRHGGAAALVVGLRRDGGTIMIDIADDGSGFPPGTSAEAPRSIRERVERRRGTLAVETGAQGTALNITLPGAFA